MRAAAGDRESVWAVGVSPHWPGPGAVRVTVEDVRENMRVSHSSTWGAIMDLADWLPPAQAWLCFPNTEGIEEFLIDQYPPLGTDFSDEHGSIYYVAQVLKYEDQGLCESAVECAVQLIKDLNNAFYPERTKDHG